MADFVWGAGGARLTPEEIAQQRKDAATLMQQGSDASAFPTGTRGAGLWTQGLARVAKALVGGMEGHDANVAATANADDNKSMIAALLGGGATATPAPASAPVATSDASPAPAAAATPASLDAETQGYIKNAADKYGVDPAYLSRTAMLESSGNPNAVNPKSGASGLFQFMPKTAKEYELDNPLDPEDSAMAAAELAKDNRDSLKAALGRDPTNAELYLAHQQGAGGAAKLLQNPNAPAASLVGNDAVVNNGGTAGMTAGQFARQWLDKYGPDAAPQTQVASNDPSFAPASTPLPASIPAAVAKVTAAMPQSISPSTVAGAQYPIQQGNTGTTVPLQQPNVAGFPAAAPMTPQAPVRFTGQPPAFVPPQIAAAPVQEADTPPESEPTQGMLPTQQQVAAPVAPPPAVAKVAAAMPATAPAAPAAPPASVATVAAALSPRGQAALKALSSPYADAQTKQIATMVVQQELSKGNKDTYSQGTDADGNQYDVNNTTHERKMFKAADQDPTSVKEYNFYKSTLPAGQPAMDYSTWSDHKARAMATNVTTNVDTAAQPTYDKIMAEALAKSHAALANGVEDAQTRARDIAAMQGAIDQIQKAGGTTGGMAPAQRLELQKSINAGAAAIGIEKPFSEADISDKEFLTKFNRSMAGAQAKGAVGSRVTNFEMSNFMKANPGLDMTVTGNQRLLGIQAQIEQRNIAVGNAIRDATASSMSGGKKIDPVTVQKIITDYDAAHHVTDPVTGQDLTQSIALPEFQTQGNNPALAADHNTNIGKIRTWHPDTGVSP